MNGDWKEFHPRREPVVREFAPGMKAICGLQRSVTGPTIEAVEGTRFVSSSATSCLSTPRSLAGMLLPNGMDGVGGVTQPHIEPGRPSSMSLC